MGFMLCLQAARRSEANCRTRSASPPGNSKNGGLEMARASRFPAKWSNDCRDGKNGPIEIIRSSSFWLRSYWPAAQGISHDTRKRGGYGCSGWSSGLWRRRAKSGRGRLDRDYMQGKESQQYQANQQQIQQNQRTIDRNNQKIQRSRQTEY